MKTNYSITLNLNQIFDLLNLLNSQCRENEKLKGELLSLIEQVKAHPQLKKELATLKSDMEDLERETQSFKKIQSIIAEAMED